MGIGNIGTDFGAFKELCRVMGSTPEQFAAQAAADRALREASPEELADREAARMGGISYEQFLAERTAEARQKTDAERAATLFQKESVARKQTAEQTIAASWPARLEGVADARRICESMGVSWADFLTQQSLDDAERARG